MDVDEVVDSRDVKRQRVAKRENDGINRGESLIAHSISTGDSIARGIMRPRKSREMLSHQAPCHTSNASKSTTPTETCRLLALPTELRDLIWIHTVTEWTPTQADKHDKQDSSSERRSKILEKRPIRMDRFNRPLPPAITRVSHQLQAETLPLYYQENIFECWRPLFWMHDWSLSTLIDWLNSLSLREIHWLRHVELLYKHNDELEHDVAAALLEQGYELNECTITSKLELSEYEQCFEQLGLPRHFGKKKRYDRWGAVHTNAS